jgi:HK97 family phage prohead protease
MSNRDRRHQRLLRAGVPDLEGREFRGVARSKPRVDTAGRIMVEAQVQLRADEDDEGPIIEGTGTVYDTWATIGRYWPFREKFAPGAFSKTLTDGADVRSMKNHDINHLLARTKAETLELWEDDEALRYRIHVNPDDPSAMSTHAQVKRGDIDGSSIWFEVVAEQWTFANEDNGLEMDEVIVTEGKLHETGPVVFPAYETTESHARALDTILRAGEHLEEQRQHVQVAIDDPSTLLRQLQHAGVDVAALARLAAPDDDSASQRAAEEAPAADAPPRRHESERRDHLAAMRRLTDNLIKE